MAMGLSSDPLRDKLILLIEEDDFIAGYVGDGLIFNGSRILGPARSVDEANCLLESLRAIPDAAVVSLTIFQAAGLAMDNTLKRLGVPLLLIGKRSQVQIASALGHDVLTAPFAAYQVVDHVRAVVNRAKTSTMWPTPSLRGH